MFSAAPLEGLGDVGPLLADPEDAADQDPVLGCIPAAPGLLGVQVVVPALPALLGAPEVQPLRPAEDVLGDFVPSVGVGLRSNLHFLLRKSVGEQGVFFLGPGLVLQRSLLQAQELELTQPGVLPVE